MEIASWRPLLAPTVSMLCALLIFLTGANTFLRRFWSLGAATIKFIIVLSLLPAALRGVIFYTKLLPFAHGVTVYFRVDPMGLFFALVTSTLWIVTTVYAIGYMEPEHAKVRFFGFFALCVSTTVGIAFSGNLFTLFIFYEMLTIATYPLVIHEETPEAMKAGRKYLVYTLTAGAFLLLSIVMTFYLAGTTELSKNGILSLEKHGKILYLLFATFIVGFGVKAAIMPLHSWLPTAMVAPTPVSALLHAVAVVKAGVFGVLRVIYNVFGVALVSQMGVGLVLAWVAVVTIICGSILALLQDNLKRRLAYSTVSQLSYIILGASLAPFHAPSAALASIIHIAHQGFQKITLFFVAGAIERKTGKRNISEMEGIGHKMPITMATFSIASLGFIGIPLLAGFISKWYMCLGSLEAGGPIFVVVMLVSALLNAAYWLPIIYIAYFRNPPDGDIRMDEAHWLLLYPCIICAIYVIALGTLSMVPGMPVSLAETAVGIFLR
ncbi:MAG: monovalent cation/H+ antiporter subunit D family protein [Actinomycetota bacterium]